MVLKFLHIVITATIVLSNRGMLCSDSKNVYEHELLISRVNISSDFICDSIISNTSVIWERYPGGHLLYSIDRVNPDSEDRFVMKKTFTPKLILTLKQPRVSDAGTYLCKQELTEVYLKHLTHIVIESDPDGCMIQDETNDTVHAWCSITYAGNNSLYNIIWFSQTNDNITILNTNKTLISTETRLNTTTTNSTIIVTDLVNGSVLICQILFKIPNYDNSSKFTFNWTSPAVFRPAHIESTDHYLSSAALTSSFSFSETYERASHGFISSDNKVHDSTSTLKDKSTTVEDTASSGTNLYILIIGMTVAFVAIVVILIVVIICMYAYVRSKTAASSRRRMELDYAMPLPAEQPLSTSYEKIDHIYHEPNANRGSIISSHSYNYPERYNLENAPPLPGRDIMANQFSVEKKNSHWTNAETSFDEDEKNRKLIDPGSYLKMPETSPDVIKKEKSTDCDSA